VVKPDKLGCFDKLVFEFKLNISGTCTYTFILLLSEKKKKGQIEMNRTCFLIRKKYRISLDFESFMGY
jgi:hypothetical protein